MAMKEYGNASQSNTTYITLGGHNKKGEKNPTSITGRYLGKLVGPNKFRPGEDRVIYGFKTEVGTVFVNGNVGLIQTLDGSCVNYTDENDSSPIGAMCHVQFLEMIDIKGGKTMKTFSVGFDNEDVEEVEELISDSSGSTIEEDYGLSVPVKGSTGSSGASSKSKAQETLNRHRAN